MTLRGVFGKSLIISRELNEWAKQELAVRVTPSETLRDCVDGGPNAVSGLYPFQSSCVEFGKVASDFLLCDEMGLGKTIQILSLLRVIHSEKQDVLPAIVICPNSVKESWNQESRKWFPAASIYVVSGTAAKRTKTLTEASKDPTALVVINTESVRLYSRLAPYGSIKLSRCRECDPRVGEEIKSSRCDVHPKILNSIQFRSVIVDEIHRCKDPHSKQTRAVWNVAHQPSVQRRIGMTGTPIANHPGELWSVMHAISPEEYPSRLKFIDRYCQLAYNPYAGMDIVGLKPDTVEEFRKFFNPRFRRILKSRVLPQLPKKVRSYHFVDMSPKQTKAYKEISDILQTELPDGSLLSTPGHLERRLRLLQLAQANVEIDKHDSCDWQDWTVNLVEPCPKLDALELIIESLASAPFVVCAQSRQLIDLAATRLTTIGLPYGMIVGDMREAHRNQALEDFQSGKTQCLLFTIQAGGTGLTMTRAGTMVRLMRSDSMVNNLQVEDRIHRIGSEQHESVHIIDVVTRNTVEDEQIGNLQKKMERLDQITQDNSRTDMLDAEYQQIITSTLI